MSYKCNEICHKLEMQNKGEHYARGEKFCSICDRFMLIFSNNCCCCNSPLRKSRLHKTRRIE